MGEVGNENKRRNPNRLQTRRTEEERQREENDRLLEEKKDLIAEIALLKKKMEIEERLRSSKDSALLTFSEILKP